MNYLNIDVKIWIFLQNITLLNSDSLKETEEYDIFKTACELNTIYYMSERDILDNESKNIYYFKSFTEVIISLKNILEIFDREKSMKYKIVTAAIPIMERISVENALEKLNISFEDSFHKMSIS